MTDITTAFWGMVINNYDETDLALVQQGYGDFVKQLVYTPERGEDGTPHIQAYIRLYRQQRLSYVKKLFPRGHFTALTCDEYKLNTQRYAQKQDDTAEGPSVITNNPFPDPVVELTSVLSSVRDHYIEDKNAYYNLTERDVLPWCSVEERFRVAEKPTLAKFYVSATYKAVKKEFWRSILRFIVERDEAEKKETHTHTHTQRKIIFSTGDIPTYDGEEDDEVDSQESGSVFQEDSEGEGDEDDSSEASSGYDEGGSACSGSSDACSES